MTDAPKEMADFVPDIEIEQHLIADKYYRRGLERAAEIVGEHEKITTARGILLNIAAAIRAEKEKT